MDLKKLLEQTDKDYTLAAVLPADEPFTLELFARECCPVLRLCRGPLGVLRGLDHPGRRQGIMGELARNGREVAVTLLCTPKGEKPAIHWWKVRVFSDDPRPVELFADPRPNYARDRMRGAQGD